MASRRRPRSEYLSGHMTLEPRILATLLSVPLALAAQLPSPTSLPGVLRIELHGAFHPALSEFADGTRRDVGAPLTVTSLGAATTPLVGDLERQLSGLLGRPATALSLGALTTIAEFQRGVGTIGLAFGVTRRITLFADIPIVSVRTQATLTPDVTSATLGINPALQGGTGAGQTTQFFTEFDAALAELTLRTNQGDYAGNPELQSLAQQTLADGPALRDALFHLLSQPGRASAVLPVGDSPDGAALLTTIADFRGRFDLQFGITGFVSAPALPATAVSDAEFASLLGVEEGFALEPLVDEPVVGFGDITVGAVALLFERGDSRTGGWLLGWLRGGVTLPTGAPPDPRRLRDQGTGDRQLDVEVGGVVEVGRGRFGMRADASWRGQFTGERSARIGTRDQFLLPTSLGADLSWNPGDVVTVQVQPFFRIAQRLALTGVVRHWRKGADDWRYRDEAAAIPGVDPAIMNTGTAADATIAGIGISYRHDGRHDDGKVLMPVEAGFSLERIVATSRGLVTAAPSTKMYFRVYWPLLRR